MVKEIGKRVRKWEISRYTGKRKKEWADITEMRNIEHSRMVINSKP